MTDCRSSITALFFVVCLVSYKRLRKHRRLCTGHCVIAQDRLMRGFQDPPNGARPRVWWHWMNGNIAPEGIEAGSRVDASRGAGWSNDFRRRDRDAAGGAASAYLHDAGVEAGLQLCGDDGARPGNGSGDCQFAGMERDRRTMGSRRAGHEEDGVERDARRGRASRFAGACLIRPRWTEHFRTFSVPGRRRADGRVAALPQFYADAAVVAYRIPDGDKTQAELNPQVTSSGGTANVPELSDGDVNTVALELPAGAPGSEAWVQFDYGHPQRIQAVTLAALDEMISVFDHESNDIPPRLEASDDGRELSQGCRYSAQQRARAYGGVQCGDGALLPACFTAPAAAKPGSDHRITELVLASGARVNEFEKRAGYANATRTTTRSPIRKLRRSSSCRGRCDRPDRQDEARWHARLDAARG